MHEKKCEFIKFNFRFFTFDILIFNYYTGRAGPPLVKFCRNRKFSAGEIVQGSKVLRLFKEYRNREREFHPSTDQVSSLDFTFIRSFMKSSFLHLG